MGAFHLKKWLGRMSCCSSPHDVADDYNMVIQVLDTHATFLATKRGYQGGEHHHELELESSGPISGVWRKGIIMGKKCQLPDYSGAIIYDSAGRLLLNPPKTPLS
ncbi:hypothetical protein Scep_000908 [Stephania cephalantha]|uniref:Uncharacterized protein n=1 Tax=Stephania cephalantha TaxID=152367 RepID=A0AAP0L6Y5_9MAGN